MQPQQQQLRQTEKITLTAGRDYRHTYGVPRLGIPEILLADGPHGVRHQHQALSPRTVPATCFPTASAIAATWDVALVERVGVALGLEARAERVSVLLGPGVNIKRSALCGRDFEYFSEDPHLSGRLAAAWIRGVQSTGVGASLKHFAANNQEHRRFFVDALVDERALREIYLSAFEYAIRTEQPVTVMAAYNRLRGVFCTVNAELLTRILREEWGFEGAVVSDWGATKGRAAAIAAGTDLTMPGLRGRDDAETLAAVRSGDLPPAALDRAARAVQRVVERTAPVRARTHSYDAAAHHELARRVAAAGTVLLRNEGGILPLNDLLVSGDASVAVIGAFAVEPRYQGSGSSRINPHRVDNAHEALAAALGRDRVHYAEGYRRRGPGAEEPDPELIAAARAVAVRSDVAVIFVGLPDSDEIEGRDRVHLELPAAHNELIATIAAQHRRVVVVLANGAPVAMPWLGQVGAVVEGYLGGQAGGSAVTDVLLGRAEPGGRLAETFPHGVSDNPVYAMPIGPRQVEYRESVYVGYRYYDTAGVDVAFPFGFGLSYTEFAWSDPAVRPLDGGGVAVSLTVANVGRRAGSEVVQLYVHDVAATVFRPVHELRGFAKAHLAPGESKRVTITLGRDAFAFWDTRASGWAVENGDFELRLGASSRDIRVTLPFTVSESTDVDFEPGPEAYHAITTATRFAREDFAHLYGRPLPENAVDERGSYTLDTPIADMDHPLPRMLLRALRYGIRWRLGADSPEAQLTLTTIEAASPRMLLMLVPFTRAWQMRALVTIANGWPRRRPFSPGLPSPLPPAPPS